MWSCYIYVANFQLKGKNMFYITNKLRGDSWMAEAQASREAKMHILAVECEKIAAYYYSLGD